MKKNNPFGASKLPRYSDENLALFKVKVEAKLKTAKIDFDNACQKLIDLRTDKKGDMGDEANLAICRATIMEEKQRAENLKNCLEGALIRIENKTYGIDRKTGNLIPKERLLLVPHATLDACTKNENPIH